MSPSVEPAIWHDRYSERPYSTATKPLFFTKPIQPLSTSPSTHSRPSPGSASAFHVSPSGHLVNTRDQCFPTSPRPHASNTGYIPGATSDAPTYSFGVFKSNPDGSSLDHIASTTTLRRGRPNTLQQGLPAEGANGFTPGFTVTVAQPTAPKFSSRQRHDGRIIQSDAPADGANNVPPFPSGAYSSFLLSDSPGTSNEGTMVASEQDQESNEQRKIGEKGKVHECPHCSKRFNRPSSLQIHANTHTGARRE